jgi:hypothetical protein
MGQPIDGEYIDKANHTRDYLTSESTEYGVLVYTGLALAWRRLVPRTDKRGDRGSD